MSPVPPVSTRGRRPSRAFASQHEVGPTAPRPDRLFSPPDWRWTQSGDVGWWVRADWSDALIDAEGRIRFDQWRRDGRLQTVKAGPHRVVYRIELPTGSIYVKHFLVPDFRALLRQWFRRGKGRNEGRRARKLAAVGVPTITPIALGEQRRRRFLFENYLVTPAIDATIPLDEFVERRLPELPEGQRARLRRRLAEELAVFTARIHDAGFLHSDFHPGNILVRLDADDDLHLAMIDLDALRVVSRLSWPKLRENLAHLDHYFWVRCNRADRYRFFRRYLEARGMEPADPAALARQIERTTRAWAERLWTRWGKRCRGTNKYFAVYKGTAGRAIASRDLDPAEVGRLLADPDGPINRPDAVLIKHSRTTTVVETSVMVGGRPTAAIYKRFNVKKWLDPVLNLFRPSRAWRAWQAGQHLCARGIPTPQNLAYVARKPGLLPRETYLLTIKAEPSITLGDYLRDRLPGLPADRRRERIDRITAGLARLLRTMHERSLSHRDLKSANILLEGDPDVGEPRLSLIDLVGVQLQHPLPWRRRIQNLARLNVSLAESAGRVRSDGLRFLLAYLSRRTLDRTGWKRHWRSIQAASDRKSDRNRRTGRPLS